MGFSENYFKLKKQKETKKLETPTQDLLKTDYIRQNATVKPDIQVETPKTQVETPKATEVKTPDHVTVTSQPQTQTVIPYSAASIPVQKNEDNTIAHAQDKGNIEKTSLTKDVQSTIDSTPISVQNSTTGAESTNLSDTSTTSYAQSYDKSLAYDPFSEWLYKDPTKYGGKNSYLDFEKNVNGFLDSVKEDISEREREYTNKNEYGAEYDKRTEQLNLVLDRLDWYEQYFTQTKDGWEHWKSAEEIEEMLFALRGYREKAENLLYRMSGEKSEIDRYTTENHWITYTDPVGALEKINSADIDNLTNQQKADIEELTKWLSQYNTENAFTDALKLMSEGKSYEDLKAERDLTSDRLGVLRTGNGIYGSETTSFEKNLIKGYENYLAYLDMMMGYFEEVKYMSYRNREDYYSLGVGPEENKNLTPKQRHILANKYVRNPYYYINDVYGTRGVYATSYNTLGTEFQKYDYMTESEIRTYNYIYATEGEKAANKYIDYLTNQKTYWMNEQGEYVSAATGLESRRGKDIAKKSNNVVAKGMMAAVHGADSFIRNMKQLFSDEAIPESAYQYAYDYLYNDAGEFGKRLLSLVSDTVEGVPTAAVSYLATLIGHPEIGIMAAGAYAGIDEYGETMQNGGTPIEASVKGLSAVAKGTATSLISDVINEKMPKMSAEMLGIWNRPENSLAELLTAIEGKVMDKATEAEISHVVEEVLQKTIDGKIKNDLNHSPDYDIAMIKVQGILNEDYTFSDNKYSQFSRQEQEMLKLLEKSYKAGTIVRQEYEEELKRYAKWMSKDQFLYLDYIKLLGIL